MNMMSSYLGDRQQSRGELDDWLGDFMHYYFGPTGIPDRLSALNQLFNPIMDLEEASQSTQAMVAPGQTAGERFGHGVDAATSMASFLGPAAGGTYAAKNTDEIARFLEDVMTGVSMKAQGATDAGRRFAADEYGGIKAYHGSPHDFDEFRMDRIGTGEGAQAYGHGLYFAENEATAKAYREALAGRAADRSADVGTLGGKAYKDLSADERAALRMVKDWGDPQRAADAAVKQDMSGEMLPRAKILNKMAAGDLPYTINSGRMYEVEIDANPEDFLDWDAPLSEQGGRVKQLLTDYEDLGSPIEAETGASLYKQFERQSADDWFRRNKSLPPNMQDEASKYLAREGIPGIRYYDQGSRTTGEGTRNYVVFDENLIKVVKKYGIAGAAAMLGMSAAEVEAAINENRNR